MYSLLLCQLVPFMLSILSNGPFANSVDPDKIAHSVVFDQGFHFKYRYFLKKDFKLKTKLMNNNNNNKKKLLSSSLTLLILEMDQWTPLQTW